MPRRKKTRHGATQPESEREKKQLLLRLRPEVIDDLREIADDLDITVSELVTRAACMLGGEGSADLLNELRAQLEDEREGIEGSIV